MRSYKKHEIEDLGAFGVWWYQGSVSVWWAYALRDGEVWKISQPRSGFESRDAAIAAARAEVGA